jgi:hypothetical protein
MKTLARKEKVILLELERGEGNSFCLPKSFLAITPVSPAIDCLTPLLTLPIEPPTSPFWLTEHSRALD